jgi:hypothetical protein
MWDLALLVACAYCGAEVGDRCQRRTSGKGSVTPTDVVSVISGLSTTAFRGQGARVLGPAFRARRALTLTE